MTRKRRLSPQARLVLAVMLEGSGHWTHGYELSKATGVRSGTLYPLLMRLESQGYLEAQWQASQEPGRPPRHAYRLTQTGAALARESGIESAELRRLAGKGAAT